MNTTSNFAVVNRLHGLGCAECAEAVDRAITEASVTGSTGATFSVITGPVGQGTVAHSAQVARWSSLDESDRYRLARQAGIERQMATTTIRCMGCSRHMPMAGFRGKFCGPCADARDAFEG